VGEKKGGQHQHKKGEEGGMSMSQRHTRVTNAFAYPVLRVHASKLREGGFLDNYLLDVEQKEIVTLVLGHCLGPPIVYSHRVSGEAVFFLQLCVLRPEGKESVM